MVQQTHVLGGARRAVRPRSRYALAGWPTVVARLSQVAADAGLVWLAFWLAYQVRYGLEWGGTVRVADFEPFGTFQNRAALFVALTVALLFLRGLYRLPRTVGFLDEAQILVGGVTTAMAGVILTAFLARFVPSRLVFLYAWGAAIVLLLARRMVTRWIRRWLWSREIGVDRVLIVGAGETGRRLMQAMMGRRRWGIGLSDSWTMRRPPTRWRLPRRRCHADRTLGCDRRPRRSGDAARRR